MVLKVSQSKLLLTTAFFYLSVISPVSFAGKADAFSQPSQEAVRAVTSTDRYKNNLGNEEFQNRYQAAVQLVQNQKYDQALKAYKKLVRQYRNIPGPGNDMGVVYQLQGKLELASKQFRKIIKKFPQYAPAYENLADTLAALASRTYIKALEHSGSNSILEKKAEISARLHQVALQSVEQLATQEIARKNTLPASQQVVNTMHSWVNAWNKRDLETYLSHYSSGFVPAKGKSVQDWAKRHQDNFSSSEYIRVYLDSIKMQQIDPTTVAVSFRELYESNLFETSSEKKIVVEKVRNSWLIKSEAKI